MMPVTGSHRIERPPTGSGILKAMDSLFHFGICRLPFCRQGDFTAGKGMTWKHPYAKNIWTRGRHGNIHRLKTFGLGLLFLCREVCCSVQKRILWVMIEIRLEYHAAWAN